jgi:imidazolonepropionase-like amidohydrolase/ABC-type multidrug transport system permease subunit
MRAYLAIARIDLLLAARNRSVLFFNYIFPLIFFFAIIQFTGSGGPGAVVQTVTMVLILGVLGNGLFGAGMRAVMEREANILRRFKVAPISPVPILVASMATGLITYLPLIFVVLAIAHWGYGMPLPKGWGALIVVVSFGVVAFRAIGLIAAAVVNSMQEASILLQLLYLPMLLLSGATIPTAMLPNWMQTAAQFMPASYLSTAIQEIMLRGAGIRESMVPLLALLLTTVVATFVAVQLFRWEKEEKIRNSSKAWILAAMAPFLLLGLWQAYSRDHVQKTRVLYREMRRAGITLIRNVRVLSAEGATIEAASVLVQNGRIEGIYPGGATVPETPNAQVIEGAGKTLLPGFVDAGVNLMGSGGVVQRPPEPAAISRDLARRLAASLYSGVVAVRTSGDLLAESLKLRRRVEDADLLGADVYPFGPIFTSRSSPAARWLDSLPAMARDFAEQSSFRFPESAEEARRQVMELQRQGVSGITISLRREEGATSPPLPEAVLEAIVEQARSAGLVVIIQVGSVDDLAMAIPLAPHGVEASLIPAPVPEALFVSLRAHNITFLPALAAVEAAAQLAEGRTTLFSGSLEQQTAGPAFIAENLRALSDGALPELRPLALPLREMAKIAMENLRRAHRHNVPLAVSSNAGHPLLLPGAALHRELQLWGRAGIPPAVALTAATRGSARLLRMPRHAGEIVKEGEATLVLIDGNPLTDLSFTSRISDVFLQGERIRRQELLEDQ